jgi:hypothetical protein
MHPSDSASPRCVQVQERLPVDDDEWMNSIVRLDPSRSGQATGMPTSASCSGAWTSESAKRKRGVLSSDDLDDGCPHQNDCFRSDAQAGVERHWPFLRRQLDASRRIGELFCHMDCHFCYLPYFLFVICQFKNKLINDKLKGMKKYIIR